MNPSPGEIYYLDDPVHRLGKSDYGRYVLVVRVDSQGAEYVFGSSKVEYARPSDFVVHKDRSEFPATGLTEDTCFILHPSRTIPISSLKMKRGEVSGDLRRELEDWWGAPF